MADFILFDEGAQYLLQSGLPSTVYLGLATDSVDATSAYSAADGLDDVAEITGTGYTRKSQSEPTPTGGIVEFTAAEWETGAATDWPSTVRSCFCATTADDSGVVLFAWNLRSGGAPRDLSGENTTQTFTGSVTLSD